MDGTRNEILSEIHYIRNRIDEVYDLMYKNCADCERIEERLNNHIAEHKRLLKIATAIIGGLISAKYFNVI